MGHINCSHIPALNSVLALRSVKSPSTGTHSRIGHGTCKADFDLVVSCLSYKNMRFLLKQEFLDGPFPWM